MKTLIHALLAFWIMLLIGDFIIARKAFTQPDPPAKETP